MRVCHISTFPPTQCGIASYTADLIRSLSNWESTVVRVVYPTDDLDPDSYLRLPITSSSAYSRMGELIDDLDIDVVSLQHEFGIFGGRDGQNVLSLVGNIRQPIITTLHTVEVGMTDSKRGIITRLSEKSDTVITLTARSRGILSSHLGVPAEKTKVIMHGIPKIEFKYPEEIPLRKRLDSSIVFISAGHFRPTKGYETALQALSLYKRTNPDFSYLIVGTDQPQFTDGRGYRTHVRALIKDLQLSGNVEWIDEHVPYEALKEYVRSADIGLVSYTDPRQTSSGIIPLILGCGRPVVATEFDYASLVAQSVQGMNLVAIDDPSQMCTELLRITENRTLLRSLMVSAYKSTRAMLWTSVGLEYERVFREAVKRQ